MASSLRVARCPAPAPPFASSACPCNSPRTTFPCPFDPRCTSPPAYAPAPYMRGLCTDSMCIRRIRTTCTGTVWGLWVCVGSGVQRSPHEHSNQSSLLSVLPVPPSLPFHVASSDSLPPILSCVNLLPSLPDHIDPLPPSLFILHHLLPSLPSFPVLTYFPPSLPP